MQIALTSNLTLARRLCSAKITVASHRRKLVPPPAVAELSYEWDGISGQTHRADFRVTAAGNVYMRSSVHYKDVLGKVVCHQARWHRWDETQFGSVDGAVDAVTRWGCSRQKSRSVKP